VSDREHIWDITSSSSHVEGGGRLRVKSQKHDDRANRYLSGKEQGYADIYEGHLRDISWILLCEDDVLLSNTATFSGNRLDG
jgi:hypothetical protein